MAAPAESATSPAICLVPLTGSPAIVAATAPAAVRPTAVPRMTGLAATTLAPVPRVVATAFTSSPGPTPGGRRSCWCAGNRGLHCDRDVAVWQAARFHARANLYGCSIVQSHGLSAQCHRAVTAVRHHDARRACGCHDQAFAVEIGRAS